MKHALLSFILAALLSGYALAEPLPRPLNLPPGFKAEIFARVPGARSLLMVDVMGTVFVSTRGDGVYAIPQHDGKAGEVRKVLTGLKVPNGIAWKDGYLYVAEQHRLVRFIAPTLDALAKAEPEVLFTGFPDDPWHGWRYAGFGPDGRLYVAVGSPCNICAVNGLEGTIVVFDPPRGENGPRGDGGDPRNPENPDGEIKKPWKPEVFARGVRNSVGFDFHPMTRELHFTDNGADRMGDDTPPDELNHAPKPGLHFGFPWFGGGDARTGEFANDPLPGPMVYPEVRFGAHVAALGIDFYDGNLFPQPYKGSAFVAQHGSWNRSVPDGYRVARVRFDEQGRAAGHETFAEGWLVEGSSWGRPVDVEELPDGSLLVSDDKLGAVYRITYEGR